MDEVDALAEQLRSSVDRLSRSARRAQALPPGEAAVLGALDRAGPQTIARLADERGVRHQTAAKIVAQLEAADLVTKRSHPDDARMVQVRLTRRGAATLRKDRARGPPPDRGQDRRPARGRRLGDQTQPPRRCAHGAGAADAARRRYLAQRPSSGSATRPRPRSSPSSRPQTW